jgi:hypothetical protein
MERGRGKVITLVNTDERPLSEREVVDATLAFANGSDLRIDGTVPPKYPEDAVERLQALIRNHLERVLSEPTALARELWEAGWLKSPGVWARAHEIARAIEGGIAIDSRGEYISGYQIANRGVALLLDPRPPRAPDFQRKLCQCQFSECRRFFLEAQRGRGRPQRLYCCKDHMLRGHDERGEVRMKNHRAKKKGAARRSK